MIATLTAIYVLDLGIAAVTIAGTLIGRWSWRFYRQERRLRKGILSERHWAILGFLRERNDWVSPGEIDIALDIHAGPWPEIDQLQEMGYVASRWPPAWPGAIEHPPTPPQRRQYRALP